MMQLCHSSRSNCEWVVAEGTLTTLVTAALGNEKMCRRLLRVGLDQLIDAAEDDDESRSRSAHQGTNSSSNNNSTNAVGGGFKNARPHRSKTLMRGTTSSSCSGGGGGDQNITKRKHHLSAMPGAVSASPPRPRSPPTADPPPRGPATDEELGLDQIDEVGVNEVLRQSSDALALRMQGESRKTCSALATSLLQALGPFNYVRQCFNQPRGPCCCISTAGAAAASTSIIGAGLNDAFCQVFT